MTHTQFLDNRFTFLAVATFACLIGAAATRAASPDLQTILPRGGQRGSELEISFRGARLADAKEILVYEPGLSVEDVRVVNPGEVKARLKIAPAARLGEHVFRVRTASGVSDLRNFFVDPYPTVQEAAEPSGDPRRPRDPKAPPVPPEKQPSTFAKPQSIDLNVTVEGLIENEQVDYYVVQCKQGQRLTAEVEGMRLGSRGQQNAFDPAVAILDTSRFELVTSDDTALLKQDCVASVVIPKDGPYVIAVRDSTYGGGPNAQYRMHVGTFPRPLAVYPPGGKAGESMKVRFVGDVKGPIEQTIQVPDQPGRLVDLFAEQDGLIAPSPNAFRVSPVPNVLEAEPNDDVQHASGAESDSASTPPAPVPIAFNGIIEKDGDVDFFKFRAAKGQVLDVRIYARAVRSPLDSVLTLHDAKGGTIAANDDSGGPDSYLRFNVPADGEYHVSVRDHLKHGGPEYVYRIEITPIEPRLTLSIPPANQVGVPTQERQTIVVPRGNRFGTLIRATRADFGGDLSLKIDGLPEGIRMIAEPWPAGQDVLPVLFEAAPDAPVTGNLCDLTAAPSDSNVKRRGRLDQPADLAYGPNNTVYHTVRVDKLAVAVAEEVPFSLKIVPPRAPLAQSGSMELKVVAERKGDFKGPITLKMLFDPPGVSAGLVTIPPDKDEFAIPLSSTPNAPAKSWKIAVLGQGDVGGAAWVCSPLADLQVVPPFVTAKITRTAIEQGKGGQVKVAIEQKNPFEGKAKVELLGLPNGVTTEAKEITSADKEVVFDVKSDPKSPAGSHGTLICRVTVMKDGEPVVQNLGRGGVLRIDTPKVGATPASAAARTQQTRKP